MGEVELWRKGVSDMSGCDLCDICVHRSPASNVVKAPKYEEQMHDPQPIHDKYYILEMNEVLGKRKERKAKKKHTAIFSFAPLSLSNTK